MTSKKITTIVLIFIIIAGAYGIKLFFSSQGVDSKGGSLARIKGEESALVQITEFIDFQCPACALGAKYLKKVMKDKPSLIRLEMKYYPLERIHKHAILSAQYTECAAREGKFWSLYDLIIERQRQWYKLDEAKPIFDLMVNEIGLDKEKMASCLDDEKILEIIQKDKEQGKAIGLRSTPTYVVNGEVIVGVKSLKKKLESYLQ